MNEFSFSPEGREGKVWAIALQDTLIPLLSHLFAGARSGGSQLRKFTTKPSERSLLGPSTWLTRTTSSSQFRGAEFGGKEQCGLGKMDKL